MNEIILYDGTNAKQILFLHFTYILLKAIYLFGWLFELLS